LDGGCDWIWVGEKLAPDVSGRHERVDVSDVVREGEDVAHLPADSAENRLDVLEYLAGLDPHVALSYDQARLVEGDLALEVDDHAAPLNRPHRECAERRPYRRRIESVCHPVCTL
jgi:hypothetical protein